MTPLSTIIGSPLSGLILKVFEGVDGLHNWQWLFLVEAIPSFLLAFVVLRYLDNDVKSARWLSDAEKQVVIDDFHIGLLAALPYLFGACFMVWNSRHSDLKQERRWHIAIPATIGCVGLALSAYCSGSTFWMMAWICLAMSGTLALIPTYISLPGALLSGTAAAAGIAFVNSIGNLAGFFGPTVLGWLKDATGRTDTGLYILAGFLLLCAPLILALPARLANPRKVVPEPEQSDAQPDAARHMSR